MTLNSSEMKEKNKKKMDDDINETNSCVRISLIFEKKKKQNEQNILLLLLNEMKRQTHFTEHKTKDKAISYHFFFGI